METTSAAGMNINENGIQCSSQEDFIKNKLKIGAEHVFDDTVPELTSTSNDEDSEWMDILGNGQLRKKIHVKGPAEEQQRPSHGDICTLSIMGTINGTLIVEEIPHISVQLGDYELVQGLELAIALMNVGEYAEIEVAARFAYGNIGKRPQIPPKTDITYYVELKEVKPPPEIDDMDVAQRLKFGEKKRRGGNWWYERKEPTVAIQCYRRALEYFQPLTKINHEKNEQENSSSKNKLDSVLDEFLQNRTIIYNNLALAQMDIGAYEAALESVQNVLRVEPENIKALYRKGCILEKKCEYTEAMKYFSKLVKLDKSTSSLYQMKLTWLKNAQNTAAEREFYRKMFRIVDSKDKTNNKNKKVNKSIIWSLIGVFIAIMGVVMYKFIEN